MSAMAFIAGQVLMAGLLILLVAALVCFAAWHLVYYIIGAKNPIGKTVLLSIAAMWVICAGILNMM